MIEAATHFGLVWTVQLFAHADLAPVRLRAHRVRWFLVPPACHAWHHSPNQPQTDGNFGMLFRIWDIIFGTARLEAPGHAQASGHEMFRDAHAQAPLQLPAQPFLPCRSA